MDCGACGKKVYKAEEISALGKSWHKGTCFVCQICKKSLNTAGDALDHDGLPYCKADYAKKFGPKGIIQGVVADSGLDEKGRPIDVDSSTSRSDFVDPLLAKEDKGKWTGVAESIVTDSSKEAQIAVERNRQALLATETAGGEEDDDMTSRVASMRFEDPAKASSMGGKSKTYVGKQLNVGGGTECRLCGKGVGFADKIVGIGGNWHKSCFKCQYCSKSFSNAGDALEANGKPCCKPCFQKNHPSSRKF